MSTRSHSELYYHFVWITMERRPLIRPQWEDRLYGYLISKCQARGYIPLAIGGIEDHLHLLLRAKPEMMPSDIAGKLKGSSSHFVNQECEMSSHFAWQEGYGVFSVCPSHVNRVIEYIRFQKRHHHTNTVRLEYERIPDADSASIIEKEQAQALLNSSNVFFPPTPPYPLP
jgi:REP element-mobilizing transposase RayT